MDGSDHCTWLNSVHVASVGSNIHYSWSLQQEAAANATYNYQLQITVRWQYRMLLLLQFLKFWHETWQTYSWKVLECNFALIFLIELVFLKYGSRRFLNHVTFYQNFFSKIWVLIYFHIYIKNKCAKFHVKNLKIAGGVGLYKKNGCLESW